MRVGDLIGAAARRGVGHVHHDRIGLQGRPAEAGPVGGGAEPGDRGVAAHGQMVAADLLGQGDLVDEVAGVEGLVERRLGQAAVLEHVGAGQVARNHLAVEAGDRADGGQHRPRAGIGVGEGARQADGAVQGGDHEVGDGQREDHRAGVPVGALLRNPQAVLQGEAGAQVLVPVGAEGQLAGMDEVAGVPAPAAAGDGAVAMRGVLRRQHRTGLGEAGRDVRIVAAERRRELEPAVVVVEILGGQQQLAAVVLPQQVAADLPPVVHRIAGVAGAVAAPIEAADRVIEVAVADAAASVAVDAVVGVLAVALQAVLGLHLHPGVRFPGLGDVVEDAARRVRPGDDRRPAPQPFEMVEHDVGAREVVRPEVGRGDQLDRQPVLLHGHVIIAAGPVERVGRDAAREHDVADLAERRVHEHAGHVLQKVGRRDRRLLLDLLVGDGRDGDRRALDLGGAEHAGDDHDRQLGHVLVRRALLGGSLFSGGDRMRAQSQRQSDHGRAKSEIPRHFFPPSLFFGGRFPRRFR